MTTSIVVADADFVANAVDFDPPVSGNLEGWWLFGGSQGDSVVNLASDGDDAGVVGAPSYGAAYASFDGVAGSYFTTSIDETASLTIIVVARSSDTFGGVNNRPAFVSAYNNTLEPTGVGLMAQAVGGAGLPAVAMAVFADYDSGTGAITARDMADFDDFRCFATVVENAVGRRMHDLTAGTSTTHTSSATRTSTGIAARTFRIGAGYGGNRGISDIAFVAIYTRALTALELTTLHDFLTPILADRGIVI